MGDGTVNEEARKLLGHVSGKRVLDLGCGTGATAVALARDGASVIAVDGSADAVHEARQLAEQSEVRVEWHVGELADLAFLRADSIDAAYADGSISAIGDPSRLFRQVQRVLRPGAPFIISLPHPMELMVENEGASGEGIAGAKTVVVRSMFDTGAVQLALDGGTDALYPHTVSSVFAQLHRAGFRIDAILEPEPPRSGKQRALVPPLIIWRARKEGS
jgi:2-polyprenyl-3-methyl-5-hydroxy-6-metoxy-1,4-benzoquinol methylase